MNVGFGIPDFFHGGVEYYFPRKNSIALNVGYGGFGDSKYYALTFNHQYFLGISKKYFEIPTWYIGDRIGFLLSKVPYPTQISTSKKLNIIIVGGRKFLIKPNFGFNCEIGGGSSILLEEQLPPTIHREGGYILFLPEIRIQFFYRF